MSLFFVIDVLRAMRFAFFLKFGHFELHDTGMGSRSLGAIDERLCEQLFQVRVPTGKAMGRGCLHPGRGLNDPLACLQKTDLQRGYLMLLSRLKDQPAGQIV